MQEIWKDIKNYENKYQVSNLGNVRSCNRYITTKTGVTKPCKGIKRKCFINRNGYKSVTLSINGTKKTIEIHRLVAIAFIPNPNNYPCVNHKDEDILNNNVNNLEWCTFKYNSNYGNAQLKRIKNTNFEQCAKNHDYVSIRKKATEKQRKQVYQYDKDLNLIKIWYSANECGRNGFSQGHVSSCCRKDKSHLTYKGFIWSYTPIEK